MSWALVSDETFHWKRHLVPDTLAVEVRDDLISRGCPGPVSTVIERAPTEILFDMPGPIITTRAMRSIVLDGLKICIPSQDWFEILAELKLSEVRTSDAGDYYKIHGYAFCLVLTPALRDAMIKDMEAQLDAAKIEADRDDRLFDTAVGMMVDAGHVAPPKKGDMN